MEPYQFFQTFRTIYEKRILTENKSYAEDQVSENYSGPELEVEVIHRITLTDSAGHLIELRMDNLDKVFDSDDKDGIGAHVSMPEGSIDIPATGPSTLITNWYYKDNDKLESDVLATAFAMYQHAIFEEGGL